METHLFPLLNFNSLITSGCERSQSISSSSISSSWNPYISPLLVSSHSRFTPNTEDMLRIRRSEGKHLPFSMKLIRCLQQPMDWPNSSWVRLFSFLICLILTFIFSLSIGALSVISPLPVSNQDSFTENVEHIFSRVLPEKFFFPVSTREISA